MKVVCMMGIYFIIGKLRLERILLPSQRMSRHESVSNIYTKVISSLMAFIWWQILSLFLMVMVCFFF